MKYYRMALILGITSALLVVSSYFYYSYTRKTVESNQAKLQTILTANTQRGGYVRKMESIKSHSQKLIALTREGTMEINYEIVLTDHDVKNLLSKVASTYSDKIFFLDKGSIESSPTGITVNLKGFKMGGQ